MIIFQNRSCAVNDRLLGKFLAAALCTPGIVFLKRSPQMDIFRGKKQLFLFVKTTRSVSGLSWTPQQFLTAINHSLWNMFHLMPLNSAYLMRQSLSLHRVHSPWLWVNRLINALQFHSVQNRGPTDPSSVWCWSAGWGTRCCYSGATGGQVYLQPQASQREISSACSTPVT